MSDTKISFILISLYMNTDFMPHGEIKYKCICTDFFWVMNSHLNLVGVVTNIRQFVGD